MSVYLEISEFIGNPIRTGIQRVVRELISHWPSDIPVRFCAYAAADDMVYELQDRTVRLAFEGAHDGGVDADELQRRIRDSDSPERRRSLPLSDSQRILVPEVFYEPARIDFYRRLNESTGIAPSVIVHDFAPYLYPDAFFITAAGSNFFLPYLYFVRAAAGRAFTNEIVADQFATRIIRERRKRPLDTIVRLGADGLLLPPQHWSPARRTILSLGSFDGKKHQDILFEAYRGSDRLRAAFDLLFIGRKPEAWQKTVFSPIFVDELRGVRIIEDASDAFIRDAFASVRASAFLGTFEGFGLPVVESLAAGVPVVAHAGLPALNGLDSAGQLRLDVIDVPSVRHALESLVDDDVAALLWREVCELRLESWSGYARAIAKWMTA